MKRKIEKENGTWAAKPKLSGEVYRNSRIHRACDVLEMYGFSKATLYRMVKAGTFPAPVSLTGMRAVGWTEASLRDWESGLTGGR